MGNFTSSQDEAKTSVDTEKISENKCEKEPKQPNLPASDHKEKPIQGCDKKRIKSCTKKKKINDEPAEIFILSSDEEDDTKSKTDKLQQTSTVFNKEPSYTTDVNFEDVDFPINESLNEDLMKNVQPGSFTTIHCRTIRIGSYKSQPKERVLMTSKGIKLVINSTQNENATIVIPSSCILKILFHFGKQIPVIFLYPVPKVGNHIRSVLGMINGTVPYYDPTSTQEVERRITLLVEKVTEDNKIALQKIFDQEKLEELTEKEANEILIRTSAFDPSNVSLNKSVDNVRKIMVYPPPPEKGGITLNNQDYACLGEDQFLNDVIIDFYLKYLLIKVLSPEDRNRTHVFSTFFYKRLTTKPKTLRKNDPENDPKLTPAEKRHMRVKGWTKQVNLFEKDFIIVPINEHSHWFLAIICFPGLSGPVRFSDNTPVKLEEVTLKKNTQTVQIGNTTITHIIKSERSSISLEADSSSDRDEAEGDQDDLHPSSEDEGSENAEEESHTSSSVVQIPLLAPPSEAQSVIKDSKPKPVKRKPFKEPIKQPCILIFDSLAGASRVRVVATLRDYLKIEYKSKLGQERDFSKDTIKGAVPKVPQQNNFTDCGLYVLQYVESFFQDPLHDFKLPLKYLQDWFPEEIVSCKRQQLACLIRTLMEEQGVKVDEIGLPSLTFSNGNNVLNNQSKVEENEEEEVCRDKLNDEDFLFRKGVQLSEFSNDYEEDMDLGLEEDEEGEEENEYEEDEQFYQYDNDDDENDDDDDEDDDEEDDDEDIGMEDEELEDEEICTPWVTDSNGRNELESSLEQTTSRIVIKSSSLVNYDSSESEDGRSSFLTTSGMISHDEASFCNKVDGDTEDCKKDINLVPENRKSVPLTDLQDFESQIQSTTIDKNFDIKMSGSDQVMSEGNEKKCDGVINEKETAVETSTVDSLVTVTDGVNQTEQPGETIQFQPNDILINDKASEVTDIIKKLANDKNITISRKEELRTDNLKNHLDVKRIKVKDCDKSEEKKCMNLCLTPKNNFASSKRSYQALKSVRIPKKTEKKLELSSKRQKVDET